MADGTTHDTSRSRVIVFGAGALGSLLGARLSRSLPVVLVTRGAHLAALRAQGLRLGGLVDARFPLQENLLAVERLARLPTPLRIQDVILLAMKAPQVKESAAELAVALRAAGSPPVTVLSLQNGTGFEDDLRVELKGLAAVHPAVAFSGATMREPGVVEDWGGEVWLPPGAPFEVLAEAWRGVGQPAQTTADVESRRWGKVLFNCALNSFCALLNARNNETVRPEWRPLRRAIFREARALAAIRGTELPTADELLESFERRALASQNVNSMLQDIQRGRPTEIEFLNGAVERAAEARGAAAPANAAVAGWIRRIERVSGEEQGALRAAAVRELILQPW